MKCLRCGNEIATGQAFCANCGAPAPEQPPMVHPVQPVYQQPIQPIQQPIQPIYQQPMSPQPKNNKKVLIIVIAVIALIIAGVVGGFVYNSMSDKSDEPHIKSSRTYDKKDKKDDVPSSEKTDSDVPNGETTQAPDLRDEDGLSADIISCEPIKSNVKVPDDFKIGLICLHDENSVNDKSFIDGLKATAKGMGLSDEQVVILTNISEDSSCYDAAVDLAKNKGCSVVFADSYGHEPFLMQAAKEYPDVEFCHASGVSAASAGIPNFHNAFAAIYEGRYITGVAAGIKLNDMIKSGQITADEAVIGFVGSFTYAEVISSATSFYLGARSVCPTATMKISFTGSWYDQAREQEAATALIENENCVLISQYSESLGAPTACELAGVPNVSYNGSTFSSCENTFIISSAINWVPYFQLIIENTVKGEKIPANWSGTIATNSIIISGVNQNVVDGKSTIAELNNVVDKLRQGKLHVFDTNTFTVEGKKLKEYMADVDGDFMPDTNVVHDGYFDESGADFRSAPYFDIVIDGVEFMDSNFG